LHCFAQDYRRKILFIAFDDLLVTVNVQVCIKQFLFLSLRAEIFNP
jgi:hypothetical protein